MHIKLYTCRCISTIHRAWSQIGGTNSLVNFLSISQIPFLEFYTLLHVIFEGQYFRVSQQMSDFVVIFLW